MEEKKAVVYEEKKPKAKKGMRMLLLLLLGLLIGFVALVGGIICVENAQNPTHFVLEAGTVIATTNTLQSVLGGILIVASIIWVIIDIILLFGFHIINPNEAMVFTLFGQYVGTLKEEGFYWLNPFCGAINPETDKANVVVNVGNTNTTTTSPQINAGSSKKISLKANTLENGKQKVNDELGNPIEIGAVVIWKVKEPTKAVFNVDNYKTYVSTQCDAIIRNVARCYPYDSMDEDAIGEKTLRGSSQEVADIMKRELQEKVDIAGLEILEARITHLSYAPEIASAMLQRQQAAAIIAARQKIVEGAVGMVEMALTQLGENNIVELDEERKAAMVSNLLVVLCGNKDAQPIVNSGSIY